MLRKAISIRRCLPGTVFGALKSHSRPYTLLPFDRSDWLVDIPHSKDAGHSKDARELNKTSLHFPTDRSNVYTANGEFRKCLNTSLKKVYDTTLSAHSALELEARKETWGVLKEELCSQFQQLRGQETFDFKVSEALRPQYKTSLALKLLNIHKLSHEQWCSILKNKDASKVDIFTYLLRQQFEQILHDRIYPFKVASVLSKGKELNISNPSAWYPEARKLKRTIVMHLGPTNSGKTYNALQKLKKSTRGYYAGPLRLLAREIYDKFKNEGIHCNLLTGEEVINDMDNMGNKAGLTSGTIEMIPLNEVFDMVVLDEIQMMGDEQRGWAWSNALLGVRATEIHLCGELSALPLVKKIVQTTGDNLVINEYKRLGKLQVEDKPLAHGIQGLQKGDCLIAFSKKRILDLKLKVEKITNYKVSVIYGSLPPETRVRQASNFNSGESEILIASDAVGMGLNLSIKRIVFTTTLKWNGEEILPLTDSNIKQIGGRAGRYRVLEKADNTQDAVGYVTALDAETLQQVKLGMNAPVSYLPSAIIWPTDEVIFQAISKYPPRTKFSTLLERFDEDVKASSENLYVLSGVKRRVEMIREYEMTNGLSLRDLIRLSYAPVKSTPLISNAFLEFCRTIANKQTKSLLDYSLPWSKLHSKYISREDVALDFYEELHHTILLYMWLNIRYPEYFVDTESAIDLKNHCEYIIFKKLERLRSNPYLNFRSASRSPYRANNKYKRGR